MTTELSRRAFTFATAGLFLSLTVPFPRAAASTSPTPLATWLLIAPDGTVTVYVARAEMGQGVYTAIPAIIAEELGAAWEQIAVAHAPSADAFRYTDRPIEVTGGSFSIRSHWDIFRRIGRTARHMLVEAAAARFGVPAASLSVADGVVSHPASGNKATFGELAEAASRVAPPADVPLSSPSSSAHALVGKPLRRLDTPPKVAGAAQYAIDVRVPGMLYAAIRQAPAFGAEPSNVAALQRDAAARFPGVRVVAIPGAVAAVAESTWHAERALEQLAPKWQGGKAPKLTSAEVVGKLRGGVASPGASARSDGNPRPLIDAAPKKITAEYFAPFLAHAPMEPPTCVADAKSDAITVWVGTQSASLSRQALADWAKLPPASVTVHTTYLGGGFGRRAETDMVLQAAQISRAVGAPVKLTWSREEDLRHDFYRPAALARLEAAVGAKGKLVALDARLATSSILARRRGFAGAVDPTAVEGLADLKYDVPNVRVGINLVDLGVPVGFWRSVGHSYTAFFVEAFLDELAHLTHADPYLYRRELLGKHPRLLRVLDTAARLAGWGLPLASGRAHGIAVHESYGSFCAQVAEVSLEAGLPRVHKVTVALDCGPVVNPDTVVAQMESSVVYALSAALYGEITLKDGAVQQGNFDDYRVLPPDAMPEIVVELVAGADAPGGVGEPGVPPTAPAVANALFVLTGRRQRTLPFTALKT